MSDGCEVALYQKKKAAAAPLIGRLFQRAELLEAKASEMLLQVVLEHTVSPHTRDGCSLSVMTRKEKKDIPWVKMQPRTQAAVLGVATGNWNRRRRTIRKYVRLFGAT